MRVMLMDGQGNFGSMDPDMPASMRYTEARLTKAAMALLEDIEKDTVDFAPTMTGRARSRPCSRRASPTSWSMAPAASPSAWRPTSRRTISAKSIDACLAYIERSLDGGDAITIDELMEIVPGPDFPTGGIILGRTGCKNAYHEGRGSIIVRSRHVVEEGRGDKRADRPDRNPVPDRQERAGREDRRGRQGQADRGHFSDIRDEIQPSRRAHRHRPEARRDRRRSCSTSSGATRRPSRASRPTCSPSAAAGRKRSTCATSSRPSSSSARRSSPAARSSSWPRPASARTSCSAWSSRRPISTKWSRSFAARPARPSRVRH